MACSNCNQSAPNTKCGCKDQPIVAGFNPTPNASCPDPTPCFETVNAQCVNYTGPDTDLVNTNTNLQDAIEILGNANITIPNLKVGAMYGSVYASLDFYNETAWLNHNPRIFLFRTKNAKRKYNGSPTNFKGRPSQFVHPTHLTSAGSKWFNGSAKYDDNYGGAPILRHTEFSIPNIIPYSRFKLEDIGLDRYEWVTYAEQSCEVVNIQYNTNYGGTSGTLYQLGTINSRPYYEFVPNGTSETFRIYYSIDTNSWILQSTSESYPNYSASLSTQRFCPATNMEQWQMYNNTGTGIIFYSFNLYPAGTTITKRQSLASDIDQYAGRDVISGNGNISSNTGIFFNMNLKNGQVGDYSFANQKIHFKLAIVIDNPNPTPESPYLIGPMSDAFVLRFMKSGEYGTFCKFTNDYISKIVT